MCSDPQQKTKEQKKHPSYYPHNNKPWFSFCFIVVSDLINVCVLVSGKKQRKALSVRHHEMFFNDEGGKATQTLSVRHQEMFFYDEGGAASRNNTTTQRCGSWWLRRTRSRSRQVRARLSKIGVHIASYLSSTYGALAWKQREKCKAKARTKQWFYLML